jgi:hypothetical protein
MVLGSDGVLLHTFSRLMRQGQNPPRSLGEAFQS